MRSPQCFDYITQWPLNSTSALTLPAIFAGRNPDGIAGVEKLQSKEKNILTTSRYLMAVAPDGSVPYLFLQSGSGDTVLDAATDRFLRNLKFSPQQGAVAWGVATITGDDLKLDVRGGRLDLKSLSLRGRPLPSAA